MPALGAGDSGFESQHPDIPTLISVCVSIRRFLLYEDADSKKVVLRSLQSRTRRSRRLSFLLLTYTKCDIFFIKKNLKSWNMENTVDPKKSEIESCGVILIGEDDEIGCLEPMGHVGPHIFKNKYGKWIAWEDDAHCSCQSCLSDMEDNCAVWREVESIEAGRLVDFYDFLSGKDSGNLD